MSYAVQSLRGLGAASTAASLVANIEQRLDALVANSRSETQKIVESTGTGQKIFDFFTGDTEGSAQRWANSIVNTAESIRSTLTRQDAQGVPFFARFPKEARQQVLTAQTTMDQLISEFGKAAETTTLRGIIRQALVEVATTLAELASMAAGAVIEAARKFPVGALVIGGGALLAAVVYLKVMRII